MTERGTPSPAGRAFSKRYTLLEKLGAGGQAEVWRARDEIAGIEVALKLLNPTASHDQAAWAALEREYAIASQLDHPGILRVYPPYREGDFAALPMELASGGDLRRLRGKSYLDVVPVLIDIAQALEYAHEHGVIHRDLKPGNVLFDARGRVRLADFGIAAAPGELNPALVRHGLSPFTASPEQLRGDPPAISDDIYGLGALAYELLSGYPPYYPRFEVKRAIEEPVPELKPAQLVPRQLVSTVMRMLAKRAALRPRSMREVIDDLDAALNDTLAFDFDRIEEPADGMTPAMRRDAAVIAAAEAAQRASAASPTHAPAQDVSKGGMPRSAPASRQFSQGAPQGSAADELYANPALAKARAPDTAPISDHEAVFAAAPDAPAGPPPADVPLAGDPVKPRATANPADLQVEPIAAVAAAVRDAAPHLTRSAGPTYWDDERLRVHPAPQYVRYQRQQRHSWPWVVLTALVAAAVLVFIVLPRYGSVEALTGSATSAVTSLVASKPEGASRAANPAQSGKPDDAASSNEVQANASAGPAEQSGAGSSTGESTQPAEASGAKAEPVEADPEALKRARAEFDKRLATLEARGAGFWGGPDFAAAKTRAAESVGANDAGSPKLAAERLSEALRLLSRVEAHAKEALAEQLAAGEKALAAGQGEVARQAFETAKLIDPKNQRALDGLQRARKLDGVLPLLADGENAEAAKDYARAVQDYSRALSIDPNNARARAGLNRAHAAFGEDSYAKAVGSGFAALGAGRLDDARAAFEKARSIRPNGPEARRGLANVEAAMRARDFASTRERAAKLEAEERWAEAAAAYDAALKVDPSLVFAQRGKARALERARLSEQLQALIDRPDRLASPDVRAEADELIKRAAVQNPAGPVLRSQIARLQILLPQFDKPVRLELVSDNATVVKIQRVGTFGTFSRREIELKPGKYTVVGTRPGFRDVRRDVTIAPGDDVQTISISCVEPI